MRSDRKIWIPQADPGASYRASRTSIDEVVRKVLESGSYILGEEGRAFEEEFSRWIGTAHGVSVASGTDALELALRALEPEAGSLVATVSHTAVATAAGVVRAGSTPLFVDVVEDTFTMDPQRLDDALNTHRGRVAAVVPVHLYGHPARMEEILDTADRHGVPVIEDCAQAHGASLGGRRVGTFGLMAAFSFYPTKNLGAFGDGGAVLTSDGSIAETLRSLRQYGRNRGDEIVRHGVNSRLDELQAAILRLRLGQLDEENGRRRSIASRFEEALAGTSFTLPAETGSAGHVYHQYVLRHPDRDAVRKKMEEAGVGTAVHYPIPVHRQPAFAGCPVPEEGLGVTDKLCGEILSLPVYPQLSAEDVQRVIDAALQAGGK